MTLEVKEILKYEALTKGMEFEFSALSFDFLRHCENIIKGTEIYEIKYFCYHLYNDLYLRGVYENFSQTIEMIFSDVDGHSYPALKNNLANLLIYLREPKVKEGFEVYEQINRKYWYDIVVDSEELSNHTSFRKYILV